MSADVCVYRASTCWREFFPYCLWDGERIEDIISNLTPEQWDERWPPSAEHEAPELRAWNDDYVFVSTYIVGEGLRVYRAPRNPGPDAVKYEVKR